MRKLFIAHPLSAAVTIPLLFTLYTFVDQNYPLSELISLIQRRDWWEAEFLLRRFFDGRRVLLPELRGRAVLRRVIPRLPYHPEDILYI